VCVQKVQSLETALKHCAEFMCALEREASTWQTTADANLTIDQLEKDYSQTKVASLTAVCYCCLFGIGASSMGPMISVLFQLLRLRDRQCIGSPQILGLNGIYIDSASAPEEL